MSCSIIIDWKFMVALGAASVGVIFAVKMDPEAAERISTKVVDNSKEYAVAINGN